MSTGRFAQRGFAFQSFAFRTWGLAGADGDVVAYETARHTLHATSLEQHTLHAASLQRNTLDATSEQRHTLSGATP
jgi:hypothetical protein